MKLQPTEIPGCYTVTAPTFNDVRGSFTKIFHGPIFHEAGITDATVEEYFSVSHRGVFRGFHFQLPPHHHAKLVWCVQGKAFDVVVDLRRDASTFQQARSFTLHESGPQGVWIPAGCAHGFLAEADNTIMLYRVSTVHAPTHDAGIRWDSVDVAWPMTPTIVSERDQKFPALATFESPFSCQGSR